jgi:hypothetical protein
MERKTSTVHRTAILLAFAPFRCRQGPTTPPHGAVNGQLVPDDGVDYTGHLGPLGIGAFERRS